MTPKTTETLQFAMLNLCIKHVAISLWMLEKPSLIRHELRQHLDLDTREIIYNWNEAYHKPKFKYISSYGEIFLHEQIEKHTHNSELPAENMPKTNQPIQYSTVGNIFGQWQVLATQHHNKLAQLQQQLHFFINTNANEYRVWAA